jgi:hypothetical protein
MSQHLKGPSYFRSRKNFLLPRVLVGSGGRVLPRADSSQQVGLESIDTLARSKPGTAAGPFKFVAAQQRCQRLDALGAKHFKHAAQAKALWKIADTHERGWRAMERWCGPAGSAKATSMLRKRIAPLPSPCLLIFSLPAVGARVQDPWVPCPLTLKQPHRQQRVHMTVCSVGVFGNVPGMSVLALRQKLSPYRRAPQQSVMIIVCAVIPDTRIHCKDNDAPTRVRLRSPRWCRYLMEALKS